MKNKDILERLTLEEKADLCTGKDVWHLHGVERLGLPSITVTDGPHGLSLKKPDSNVSETVNATCFPSAVTTAASWDRDLLYRMGQAMGEECLKEKVSVILGPGVNMKRSPLCGRNFEYFSEDPFLAGELAAGLINGVQSKGVGTALKHFAVNSQEKRRLVIDSVVDERTLREIYLTAFEIAVKKAKPWTVMNSYNKVNGTYSSDNSYLQTAILRDEWGFDGVVMSDWGAVNNRLTGIAAGNDLEMPSSNGYHTKKICEAVRNGTLDEKYLDTAADRMISLIRKAQEVTGDYTYDAEAHHELAAEICANSLVLLKNEDNTLPLSKDKTVAVIGEMARAPRFQGGGSSNIVPTKITDAFDALLEEGYKVNFAPGYFKKQDSLNDVMVKDACNVASKADAVLLFIGLTEEYESEGYDRKSMKLPASHNRLLDEILKVNENVTVVLSGGSPVVIPWEKKVKAVLNGYLGGQASGKAIAQIISGKVNPSGKLAETYPLNESDVPCYGKYPATGLTAEHREGIYIGYRYYDTAEKDVLYPFGHGLSYTQFEYSDISLSAEKIKDTDTLTVSCKIKNTGDRAGAETVQLYVSDCESTVFRPSKELRGFSKLFLEKGEEKTVTFELSKRAFAYYNINISDWHVESGEFEILIGASSRDIRLCARVAVETSLPEVQNPDYRESAPCYYGADVKNVPDKQYRALLGRDIPPQYADINDRFTVESCLIDAEHTKWGKRIITVLTGGKKPDPNAPGGDAMREIVLESPIRNLYTMGQGIFTEKMAEGLLMLLNEDGSAAALTKIFTGFVPNIKKIAELLKMS